MWPAKDKKGPQVKWTRDHHMVGGLYGLKRSRMSPRTVTVQVVSVALMKDFTVRRVKFRTVGEDTIEVVHYDEFKGMLV